MVPRPDKLRSEATTRFAVDENELGGPFGDDAPTITELLPVVDGRRLAFEAQATIATCYACSDGRWSSYTRSVRIRTAPPPLLAPYAELPSPVATFLARHPEMSFGGFAEGIPPKG